MTKAELIEYCLSLENAFSRYPYGDNIMVMSIPPKKTFCNIMENSDPLHIIVKCDPIEAQILRQMHDCIQPGYHCNKTHWNSIYIDGSLPDEEIKRMIMNSFRLVSGKEKKKKSM